MQMRPLFGDEEKLAISEYMEEDGFLTEFKRTELFENAIAEFTGSKHCVVVNNGTISLTLASLACGLNAGDEVLVPNYTMIATPNSQIMLGAKPVFIDVEETTLCMDIEKARAAINKRTKAIILVSANGRSPTVGIDAFVNLAEEHGLYLIEDAAQSLGSRYPDGRHIGRASKVASFSFSAPKIISTGQGGALITDSDEIAEKLRLLKDFGRTSGGNDVHGSIGYNFKFTELQAVIGLSQMQKLPDRISRKKEIYLKYHEYLSENKNIHLIENNINNTAPWFYEIITQRRDELIKHLTKHGIGSRKMYPPINQQAAYNIPGKFPISENIGRTGLWLPSMVQLTNQQIAYIARVLNDFK